MRYQLSGKVEVCTDFGKVDTVDHTEEVEASSPDEAIDLSLNGFAEEEEPVWCEGYPKIKQVKTEVQ